MNASLNPPKPDVSELNVSDNGLPSDIMSSDSFLMRSGIAAIICSASVNTFASESPARARHLFVPHLRNYNRRMKGEKKETRKRKKNGKENVMVNCVVISINNIFFVFGFFVLLHNGAGFARFIKCNFVWIMCKFVYTNALSGTYRQQAWHENWKSGQWKIVSNCYRFYDRTCFSLLCNSSNRSGSNRSAILFYFR